MAEHISYRKQEAQGLALVSVTAILGFMLTEAAYQWQREWGIWPAAGVAILPPLLPIGALWSLHLILRLRGAHNEQVILPVLGLLLTTGLIVLWRISPTIVYQQILRGIVPGMILAGLFTMRPVLVERIRRDWPVLISGSGLLLLAATPILGGAGDDAATLTLRLGPVAIQTSEIIKLALIIFLAWYLEWTGDAIQGEARPFTFIGFRIPPLRYFVPSALFVTFAILALFGMKDYGAILILAFLFGVILYVGLESYVFLPVMMGGTLVFVIVALLLVAIIGVPEVIEQRLIAYQDPWSQELVIFGGLQTTVADGPGYQVLHAIYATVAGGLTGTGLGLGSPKLIPLSHSDFILAAVAEELGVMGILFVLALYAVLVIRIFRAATRLPATQQFERLLLVGIGTHFFTQVFVMGAGTFNLTPITGVTVPFMSYGGMALLINLVEIGMVLAVSSRGEEI